MFLHKCDIVKLFITHMYIVFVYRFRKKISQSRSEKFFTLFFFGNFREFSQKLKRHTLKGAKWKKQERQYDCEEYIAMN